MVLIKPIDERTDQPWVAVPAGLVEAIASCLKADEHARLVGDIGGHKAMIIRGELYALIEISWCNTILERPAGLRKALEIIEPVNV